MVLHLFHVRFLTPGEPERAHVRNTSCGHAHASPPRGVFGPPVPTQTPSAQGGRGRRRSQPFAATWRAAAAAAPVVRGGGGAVRPSVLPELWHNGLSQIAPVWLWAEWGAGHKARTVYRQETTGLNPAGGGRPWNHWGTNTLAMNGFHPLSRLFNKWRMGTIGCFSSSHPLFSCMQISTQRIFMPAVHLEES